MEEIIKKGLNELRTLYSKDEENLSAIKIGSMYRIPRRTIAKIVNPSED